MIDGIGEIGVTASLKAKAYSIIKIKMGGACFMRATSLASQTAMGSLCSIRESPSMRGGYKMERPMAKATTKII